MAKSLEVDQPEKAIMHYKEALRIYPGDSITQYNLAKALNITPKEFDFIRETTGEDNPGKAIGRLKEQIESARTPEAIL